MSYLLGIDLATNGVVALLVDPEDYINPVLARVFEGHPTINPAPGIVEQEPDRWWGATVRAIRRLLAETEVDSEEIRAIGLSGQMHGLVLVDERGRPARTCITWTDTRDKDISGDMLEMASAEQWLDWTGAVPVAGLAGTRLMWVKENEPEVLQRVHKVLAPKDYLRFKLTGEYATDVSDASSSLLFDIVARKWSSSAINCMGIDDKILPRVYESQETSGVITHDVADVTGLYPGTPVVAGSGNQAAAAMGLGVIRSNEVAAVMGSGGVVMASMHEPLVDKMQRVNTLCHARRSKWYMVGLTQAAGISFRWFRDTFCHAEKEVAGNLWDDPYTLMTRQAAEVMPGSDGLMFLPYINGERSPYQDPDARGVFLGITAKHNKPHFIRAVMEGVTYSMRDCMEAMKDSGVKVDRVVMTGGSMQSDVWRHIFADTFGVDIIKTNIDDPAPFGAALMSSVAAGYWTSVENAVENLVQATDVTEPNPEMTAKYNKYFEIYKSLYPTLAPTFELMARNR
jgi:xylulokinase